MSLKDEDFTGSIPEFYDTYLVPLIFKAYAEDIARRVSALAPRKVLETAAGSGVVARSLASQLHTDARYVVTDLNQPMLDHAAAKQGPDDRIDWRVEDALNLTFGNDSFDTVVCQYGVMFYPDRQRGYEEAYRVLKSGGSYVFNVWDALSANDFARDVSDAVGDLYPDDPPQFLPRTPYGYYDHELIRGELEAAGFGRVSFTTIEEPCTAPSPRHPVIAYCHGTPLRNEIEAKGDGALARVTDHVTDVLTEKYGNGPITAKMRAHVVVAEK